LTSDSGDEGAGHGTPSSMPVEGVGAVYGRTLVTC
jgi:hypothetical protein